MKRIIPFILAALLVFTAVAFAENSGDPVGAAVYTDIHSVINGHGIRSYIMDGTSLVILEELKNYGFSETVNEDGSVDIIRLIGEEPEREDIPGIPAGRGVGDKMADVFPSDTVVRFDGVRVTAYTAGDLTLVSLDTAAEAYASEYVWNGEKKELSLTLADRPNGDWLKKADHPEISKENKLYMKAVLSKGAKQPDGSYKLKVFSIGGDDYMNVSLTYDPDTSALTAEISGKSSGMKTKYDIEFCLTPDFTGTLPVYAVYERSGGKASVQGRMKPSDLSPLKYAEIKAIHESGVPDVIESLNKTLPVRIASAMAFIEALPTD